MEDIEEDHILFNCGHEPMVVGRAVPSVSLLTFTLSLPAYSSSGSVIVHKFTPDQINKARRAFDDLGPSARLCIDYVQNPRQLETYESDRQDVLQGLSIDDLIKAVKETRNLTFNKPHTVFLLRRVELNPGDKGYLQRYTVEPITSHAMQELKFKLMKAKQEERLRVYETFEPVPQSRRLAGLAFESIVQFQLQKKVVLTLVPMVRELPTTKRRSAQWKSQFVQDLSTEDSGSVLSIGFKPHGIIQFPKPRPDRDQLGSDIYYVPESPNEVAFDSFIMNNGVLYIFQFTIMDSHPIKGDLMDFFLHQSLREILREKDWYFIFVIPPGGELVCPEPSDVRLEGFWKDVKLFTAEVDPMSQG